jgi:hypothetical protein
MTSEHVAGSGSIMPAEMRRHRRCVGCRSRATTRGLEKRGPAIAANQTLRTLFQRLLLPCLLRIQKVHALAPEPVAIAHDRRIGQQRDDATAETFHAWEGGSRPAANSLARFRPREVAMKNGLTLQQQVLLLCLNDETGKFEEMWLDYGLNGAALADLLLRKRIELDDRERVLVRDASPTGDDLLDRALGRLAQSKRTYPVSRWVPGLCRGKPHPVQVLTARLIDRDLLRQEEGRFLWIFPRTLYPAADSSLEAELRERLRSAILGEDTVEPPLAILISILKGFDALDRILTRDERKQRNQRIEAIAAADPVGRAVGLAVARAVAAAVAAAAAGAAAAAAAG